MKKLLFWLAVAALFVLSLLGCGGGDDAQAHQYKDTTAPSATTPLVPIAAYDSCTCDYKPVGIPKSSAYIIGCTHDLSLNHIYDNPCITAGITEEIFLVNNGPSKIFVEGVNPSVAYTQKDLGQFVPMCMVKKLGIKMMYGVDPRINYPDHAFVYDKFWQICRTNLSITPQGIVSVVKPLSEEDINWLRNTWYVQIVKEDIKIENQIISECKNGNCFYCGNGHLAKLEKSGRLPSGTYIRYTGNNIQEQLNSVSTMFFTQKYICEELLKLPYF